MEKSFLFFSVFQFFPPAVALMIVSFFIFSRRWIVAYHFEALKNQQLGAWVTNASESMHYVYKHVL